MTQGITLTAIYEAAEEGGYIGYIAELPGANTQGETLEEVSQSVFARYLNVTKDYVSQWERGEKRPAGPSLKLLSLIEKHGLAAIA